MLNQSSRSLFKGSGANSGPSQCPVARRKVAFARSGTFSSTNPRTRSFSCRAKAVASGDKVRPRQVGFQRPGEQRPKPSTNSSLWPRRTRPQEVDPRIQILVRCRGGPRPPPFQHTAQREWEVQVDSFYACPAARRIGHSRYPCPTRTAEHHSRCSIPASTKRQPSQSSAQCHRCGSKESLPRSQSMMFPESQVPLINR